MIVERADGKFELRTHDGKKVLGVHPSRKAAERQETAVVINKALKDKK